MLIELEVVPLSILVKKSSAFAGMRANDLPSESTLVQSVKEDPTLEARIIIADPGRNGWLAGGSSDDAGRDGGYEVRRRDWTSTRERIRKSTSFYWDSRTIYVVSFSLIRCAKSFA